MLDQCEQTTNQRIGRLNTAVGALRSKVGLPLTILPTGLLTRCRQFLMTAGEEPKTQRIDRQHWQSGRYRAPLFRLTGAQTFRSISPSTPIAVASTAVSTAMRGQPTPTGTCHPDSTSKPGSSSSKALLTSCVNVSISQTTGSNPSLSVPTRIRTSRWKSASRSRVN